MTQRENEIRNVLSSVSRKSLQNLAQASEVADILILPDIHSSMPPV